MTAIKERDCQDGHQSPKVGATKEVAIDVDEDSMQSFLDLLERDIPEESLGRSEKKRKIWLSIDFIFEKFLSLFLNGKM